MCEKEKNSVVLMTSNRTCMDLMVQTLVPADQFPTVLFVHRPSALCPWNLSVLQPSLAFLTEKNSFDRAFECLC